jgi:cobalt/nickel transport system permease protein
MMFNLPLPGGTTGHAVGIAVAAIALGPWAAMVAISVALMIQAVFFGDGGIITFAANCLNMAVAGTFVASWTYTLIAGRSPVESPRRVVAAAIAGYLAINVAALLTAFEFGIQPALFHDATGTPLYAPYPLSVALPAMMIGHLSIAGLAEALVTGGLIGWLQRSHPDVLTFAAASPRSLWAWLAGLVALAAATPLGLIAAGTAWGEWSIEDFADADTRQEILHASAGVAPPETVPAGLERLAGVWQAPLPDYAPAFLHDLSVGYVLSAAVGAGLILAVFLAAAALTRRKDSTP